MAKVTGAGVLISELYKNTNCYVFLRSKTGEYDDPGGSIDHNMTPEDTACKECREETANLLKLYPHDLLGHVQVREYRAYFAYVTGLRATDYHNNIKITHMKCPHQWRETNNIVRVPINQINLATLPNVVDYDGHRITLRGRTGKIVREAAKYIGNILKHPPSKLYKSVTQASHEKCLLGTVCYSTVPPQAQNAQQLKIKHKTQKGKKTPVGMQIFPNFPIPNGFPNPFGMPNPFNIPNPFAVPNAQKFQGIKQQKHTTKHKQIHLGGNTEYALYAAPDMQFTTRPAMRACNSQWGGLHITLCGFSTSHTNLSSIAHKLPSGKGWHPDPNAMTIFGKYIYIKSKTLGQIANILSNSGVQKVKGPSHAHEDWHVTATCDRIDDVADMLKMSTWSYQIAAKIGNNVAWTYVSPM